MENEEKKFPVQNVPSEKKDISSVSPEAQKLIGRLSRSRFLKPEKRAKMIDKLLEE